MTWKIRVPLLLLLAAGALFCFAKAAKADDQTPNRDACGGDSMEYAAEVGVFKCDAYNGVYRYVYPDEQGNPSWDKAIDEATRWYAARGFTGGCKRFVGRLTSKLDKQNEVAGRAAKCSDTGGIGFIMARDDYFTPHIENCANMRHLAFHEVGHAVGFAHTDEPLDGYVPPTAEMPWMDSGLNWDLPGRCGKPADRWDFPVGTVENDVVIDAFPARWQERVQPKKCKRPKWRSKHRKTCRRGVLVFHSS